MSKGKQAKRRRYSPEFKREAVRRMANCESVVGLARELGIHWILLYKWKRAEEAERLRRIRERETNERGDIQATPGHLNKKFVSCQVPVREHSLHDHSRITLSP